MGRNKKKSRSQNKGQATNENVQESEVDRNPETNSEKSAEVNNESLENQDTVECRSSFKKQSVKVENAEDTLAFCQQNSEKVEQESCTVEEHPKIEESTVNDSNKTFNKGNRYPKASYGNRSRRTYNDDGRNRNDGRSQHIYDSNTKRTDPNSNYRDQNKNYHKNYDSNRDNTYKSPSRNNDSNRDHQKRSSNFPKGAPGFPHSVNKSHFKDGNSRNTTKSDIDGNWRAQTQQNLNGESHGTDEKTPNTETRNYPGSHHSFNNEGRNIGPNSRRDSNNDYPSRGRGWNRGRGSNNQNRSGQNQRENNYRDGRGHSDRKRYGDRRPGNGDSYSNIQQNPTNQDRGSWVTEDASIDRPSVCGDTLQSSSNVSGLNPNAMEFKSFSQITSKSFESQSYSLHMPTNPTNILPIHPNPMETVTNTPQILHYSHQMPTNPMETAPQIYSNSNQMSTYPKETATNALPNRPFPFQYPPNQHRTFFDTRQIPPNSNQIPPNSNQIPPNSNQIPPYSNQIPLNKLQISPNRRWCDQMDEEKNEEEIPKQNNEKFEENPSQSVQYLPHLSVGSKILDQSRRQQNEEEPEEDWDREIEENQSKSPLNKTNRSLGSRDQSDRSSNSMDSSKSRQRRSIDKNSKQRSSYGFWSKPSEDAEFDEFMHNFYKKPRLRIEYKKVNEVDKDLFTVDKEYALAHCVAEDMRMGSGIAVTFSREFKRKGELLNQQTKTGDVAILNVENRWIYYLVTKTYSKGKPTIYTLWSSLKKLRDHIEENGVKKLAIPRIGCGLDLLEWSDVKPMLEFVFRNVDLEILVCNFVPETASSSPTTRKSSSKSKLVQETKALTELEKYVLIIYFASCDGQLTQTMLDLDKKFNHILDFKKSPKNLGEIIRYSYQNGNYILYGCIVKEKIDDPINFAHLEKCLQTIQKENNRKDAQYEYVAFEMEENELVNEKILSIMQPTLRNVQIICCNVAKKEESS